MEWDLETETRMQEMRIQSTVTVETPHRARRNRGEQVTQSLVSAQPLQSGMS
jgi:hypothetical protein